MGNEVPYHLQAGLDFKKNQTRITDCQCNLHSPSTGSRFYGNSLPRATKQSSSLLWSLGIVFLVFTWIKIFLYYWERNEELDWFISKQNQNNDFLRALQRLFCVLYFFTRCHKRQQVKPLYRVQEKREMCSNWKDTECSTLRISKGNTDEWTDKSKVRCPWNNPITQCWA